MRKWTRFMDMHSGGSAKEDFEYLLVELPMREAKRFFADRFGHHPDDVACQCCGTNYSVSEHASIEQATAYDRGCLYDRGGRRYVEKPRGAGYVDIATFLANPAEFGYVIIRRKDLEAA